MRIFSKRRFFFFFFGNMPTGVVLTFVACLQGLPWLHALTKAALLMGAAFILATYFCHGCLCYLPIGGLFFLMRVFFPKKKVFFSSMEVICVGQHAFALVACPWGLLHLCYLPMDAALTLATCLSHGGLANWWFFFFFFSQWRLSVQASMPLT